MALIRPNHRAASVAQWLEHLPSKQCVVGSNPTRAALFSFSVKKELFRFLVVLHCFYSLGLRVFMSIINVLLIFFNSILCCLCFGYMVRYHNIISLLLVCPCIMQSVVFVLDTWYDSTILFHCY